MSLSLKRYFRHRHRQPLARGTGLLRALYRIEKNMWKIFGDIATMVFISMIVSVIFAVIIRERLGLAVPWVNDLARFLFIWSVYLGFAVLSRRNDHIAVDVIYSFVPLSVRRVIDSLICITGAILSGCVAYFGLLITYRAFEQGQRSLSSYLPAWVGYAAVPVGLTFGALGYVFFLLLRDNKLDEKTSPEARVQGRLSDQI